jgi:hypothetical protein
MRIAMRRRMGVSSVCHSRFIHADRPEERSLPDIAPRVWISDSRDRRGCAITFALMGKAFAEANLAMMKG